MAATAGGVGAVNTTACSGGGVMAGGPVVESAVIASALGDAVGEGAGAGPGSAAGSGRAIGPAGASAVDVALGRSRAGGVVSGAPAVGGCGADAVA